MELKEIKLEIENLNKQIKEHKDNLKSLFKDSLIVLFKKYKDTIDSIVISINNHEFNDGDATHFSLYYEDMRLNFINGDEISVNEDCSDEQEILIKEFVDLFESFETHNFYESFLGDYYESVTFEFKNDKLTIE